MAGLEIALVGAGPGSKWEPATSRARAGAQRIACAAESVDVGERHEREEHERSRLRNGIGGREGPEVRHVVGEMREREGHPGHAGRNPASRDSRAAAQPNRTENARYKAPTSVVRCSL